MFGFRRRLWDGLAFIAFVALGLLIVARLQQDGSAAISGPFAAIDGDTLDAAGERLRLAGLDAPELSQTCMRDGKPWRCGFAARSLLADLSRDRHLTCAGAGRDRYGRRLVHCQGEAGDIGAMMVDEGLAVAFGGYGAQERRARDARRGIWAGDFTPPSLWRKAHQHDETDGGVIARLIEALLRQLF